MSDIVIRPAEFADLPAMTDIANWAIENTTVSLDLNTTSVNDRERWFNMFGERQPLLVADLNGEVLGYGYLLNHRRKTAFNFTMELLIMVHPEVQGQGVGKALLSGLVDEAQERNVHVLVGNITEGNETTEQIFSHMGFEKTGMMKEVAFKNGEWQSLGLWQKVISDAQAPSQEESEQMGNYRGGNRPQRPHHDHRGDRGGHHKPKFFQPKHMEPDPIAPSHAQTDDHHKVTNFGRTRRVVRGR